jgi:GDP-mannose transporter
MVGALNKLPVAASGMIFFGDPVTFGNVTAVSTGFVAGLVYAIAKTNQQKNNNSNGAGNGSGTPGSATQPLLFQKDIKA